MAAMLAYLFRGQTAMTTVGILRILAPRASVKPIAQCSVTQLVLKPALLAAFHGSTPALNGLDQGHMAVLATVRNLAPRPHRRHLLVPQMVGSVTGTFSVAAACVMLSLSFVAARPRPVPASALEGCALRPRS